MDELKNLLLEQFRFVQNPSADQWNVVIGAMAQYQDARLRLKLDAMAQGYVPGESRTAP